MLWRAVVRTDPARGGDLRRSPAWESSSRRAAEELRRDAWGRDSLSGHEPNRLFLSAAAARFDDLSLLSGADHRGDGRALALCDLDRDGAPDVAATNANAPKFVLFHNRTGALRAGAGGGGFVALRFRGANRAAAPAPGSSARDGYGARAQLDLPGGARLLREHRCGEGFAAQNSATLLVGIGAAAVVEKLTVTWPSGRSGETVDVPPGSLVTVYEDPAEGEPGGGGGGFQVEPYRRGDEVSAHLLAAVPGSAPAWPAAFFPSPPGAAAGVGSAPHTLYTLTATWCAACRGELPQLAALRDRFGPGLALVGLPGDPAEGPDKLAAYGREVDPPYRLVTALEPAGRAALEAVFAPAAGDDGAPASSPVLPSSFLADPSGRVLATFRGVPTASDLLRLGVGR